MGKSYILKDFVERHKTESEVNIIYINKERKKFDLENIVYQQLLRMGYTVSVGQLKAGEVDFVCTKTNERVYVQVTYLVASPETEEREFGCLENIKDNYPKYVISMTPFVKRSDRSGITHIGLREFLKNGF